jgi:hypothetical protein
MTALALTQPKLVHVNRSEFRDNLRAKLDEAQDRTVIEISAPNKEDERVLLDKRYFEELVDALRSFIETVEITTDAKLFQQIMRAASTLEDDTRLGKLRSFEEAFPEEE